MATKLIETNAAEADDDSDIPTVVPPHLDAPERRTRKLKTSLKNVLLLSLILLAIVVGLVLVVYGLGVVQERGFFLRSYDDTVFNGIKLKVRDR